MPTVKSFTDLEIWKLTQELDKKIYDLTQTEMVSKDFVFKDQISRSAASIADNIAEGFEKGGRLEFIQCLSIARAAAADVQSLLMRGVNRNLFPTELFNKLFELTDKVGNKIGAFIKYLNQSRVNGPKFPHIVAGGNQLNKKQPNEQPATSNVFIQTAAAAKPLGAYPHARKVGNLLFLSGIGSRNAIDNAIPGLLLDNEGNILSYDIEAECHSVFANVKAVLEAGGSSWEKIVDVTVYLTNMKKDFPLYNKIYGEYFKDVSACRTTVEVKSLPTPICIELKVIATI